MVMEQIPDEYRLAVRARAGDRDALAMLVERSRLRLFSLAYAELGHYEDAQDAVAAALLRICLHVGGLKEPGQVGPWMNAIVRNETHRLRQSRMPGATGDGVTDAAASPGEGPDAVLLRLDLEQALRRLPADQARAPALYHLSGLSVREIARRMERPTGTVKYWLHQGRCGLARIMKGHGPMTETPISETWTATVVSSDIEPARLRQMVNALSGAGWEKVNTVGDYEAAGSVQQNGDGGGEFHLPPSLRGSRYIMLDDTIGGRSAFELFPLLNATAERKDIAFCLLLRATNTPVDKMAVRSAYIAGFDLLLTKPFDMAEFLSFGKRARKRFQERTP